MTGRPGRLLFAFLLLLSILFFLRRVYILLSLVLLGRPGPRLDQLSRRVRSLMLFGFGQKKVIEEIFGVNYFFLVWGFILLQALVNIEFVMQGLFPRFSLSFLGDVPYAILEFAADTVSFIVLAVVILAILRRLFFKPAHRERTFDAFLILSLVALLMIAYFGLHGTALLSGEASESHLPFSLFFSRLFLESADRTSLPFLSLIFWWTHAIALLVFLNYIPYSKHLHILTALINCFFRRFSFPLTMPRLVFKKGKRFGISVVTQLDLERTRQALEKRPDIIATCCPYCLTMFEDALKDEKASEVRVLDVAEIAAEALRDSNE